MRGLDAESSWCAAPRLDHPISQDAIIVHLVRHPLNVIRSLLAADYYHERPRAWDRLLMTFLPELSRKPTRLAKALHHYVHWNRLIESKCQERIIIRHRIEEDVNELLERLGEERTATFEDRTYNTRRHRHSAAYSAPLRFSDLPTGDDREALMELAMRYGYPLEA